MSHPTAPQLLEAVQTFLKEAEGALSGRLAFHAKVASNVLGTVLRELEGKPDEVELAAFQPFGGVDAVCEGLRDGRIDPEDKAVQRAIRTAVLARIATDNPRYATYARLAEREID